MMKNNKLTILGILFILVAASCRQAGGDNKNAVADLAGANTDSSANAKQWWKEAIIYQLYPRSFKDSDGDGVGDLHGIISKMDYLQSLGITAVWLNPIYASPNDDNGYDVSDYRAIMSEFGTMQQFDSLVSGLHNRGIKVVMDIVVNHSSDEHEWFKQSRSSRSNPYRNYYHWWPAEKGKPPYRYSLFDEQHNAWKYDSLTDAYYYHLFSVKQPDLNWENPTLRQEIYDMMRFWADKGVDGFRLDAFQFAAKDTTWPGLPADYSKNFIQYVGMRPAIHTYLKEMHEQVFSKYNVMSVAEGAGNSFEDAHHLVDADRKELNMAYAFESIDVPKRRGYSLVALKRSFATWDSAFASEGWLSIFLGNHDNARMVSRYTNADVAHVQRAAQMLNTFLLTMRGTPYCYYGDEIGMSNPGFTKLTEYRDKSSISDYYYNTQQGKATAEQLADMQFGGRDNGRTPMQWDAGTHAGFTSGTPWISLHPNFKQVNVAAQQADSSSTLQHFKRLTSLRKGLPVLVYGAFKLLDPTNENVFAFTREDSSGAYLVLLNFKQQESEYTLPPDLKPAEKIISNYPDSSQNKSRLQPFEATVYRLGNN